jgi:hypothetical protein
MLPASVICGIVSCVVPQWRIGVKLTFFMQHLNTVIICSSRMASLFQSRMCGTAFASLKKCPSDFFQSRMYGTEPKEAPFETTGNNLQLQSLITLKLKLVLYLKRSQLFLNLMRMRICGTTVVFPGSITLA